MTDETASLRFELSPATLTLLIVMVLEHQEDMGRLSRGSYIDLKVYGLTRRCMVLSYGPVPGESDTGIVHVGPLLRPALNWLTKCRSS